MARGNGIIVTAEPHGRFVEGKLKTGITPKPGTILQIQNTVAIDANGRFTFELATPDAAGGRPKGPLLILLPDFLSGKTATDAFADSAAVTCYVPQAGEEFNLLLLDIAGTADDHPIGEILIVHATLGKLIVTTGTPETEPFQLLETITDPVADTLAHVIYTGY